MNPVQTGKQKTYKWCIVPMCTNTSCTTPKKLFIHVPKDPKTRKKWLLASRRNADDISEKSTVYCCEDHFNLEDDVENWVKFGIMGGPLKIKSGVIPHKFECQSDVYPREEITIKEEVIWPMEEENSEDEASMVDGHNSSLPFEHILVKTEPIKVEAVESTQDVEDELHSREEHSDGAITEKKDYHYSSITSRGTEEVKCSADQDFRCIQCGKEYTNSSVLNAGQKLYCSGKCRKAFWSFRTFSKQFLSKAGRKVFVCSYCELKFSTNLKFLVHLEGHDQKCFDCPKCSKAFSRRTALEHHLLVHIKGKLHVCKYCGKSFLQSATLLNHERIHTRETSFLCQECNKAFSRKCALKEHMTIHSPDKGYICSLCNKTFTRKYGLTQHKMLHTGQKRHTGQKHHICPHCGKTFGARYILLQHVRTHTGERPFHCDECGRRFSSPNCLTRHVKLHSAIGPFNCQHCSEIFNNWSERAKHFDDVHKTF